MFELRGDTICKIKAPSSGILESKIRRLGIKARSLRWNSGAWAWRFGIGRNWLSICWQKLGSVWPSLWQEVLTWDWWQEPKWWAGSEPLEESEAEKLGRPSTKCTIKPCKDLKETFFFFDQTVQHVGSYFPDQGWTCAPSIGNMESSPLDHQGSLKAWRRLMHITVWKRPIWKGYVLYDSNSDIPGKAKPWRHKIIIGCQGLQVGRDE